MATKEFRCINLPGCSFSDFQNRIAPIDDRINRGFFSYSLDSAAKGVALHLDLVDLGIEEPYVLPESFTYSSIFASLRLISIEDSILGIYDQSHVFCDFFASVLDALHGVGYFYSLEGPPGREPENHKEFWKSIKKDQDIEKLGLLYQIVKPKPITIDMVRKAMPPFDERLVYVSRLIVLSERYREFGPDTAWLYTPEGARVVKDFSRSISGKLRLSHKI